MWMAILIHGSIASADFSTETMERASRPAIIGRSDKKR